MDGRSDGGAEMDRDAGPAGPPPFEMPFAAEAGAPRLVRRALASWLDDRGLPAAWRDDVSVVVSELVTNAVIHAPSAARVRASLDAHVLRLEVHDASAAPPAPRQPGGTGPGGYGLRIVAGLSADWGWFATPSGKYVWTEHARPLVRASSA